MGRPFVGIESAFEEVLQNLSGDCVLSLDLAQVVTVCRWCLLVSCLFGGRGFVEEGRKAKAACRMREDRDRVVSRFVFALRFIYLS